ncbi:MAG: MgtC/SapB family protein [Prolixibacteraceae bacterium]|nr:MgtC/SapB family protein [Prolixibacteraceae bacterium]
MEFLNEITQSTEINTTSSFLRLTLSFIAGTIIGFERETHRQPAGLRTHILICMGSTLIMLLSIYIPQTYTQFHTSDPGRIAAQVVSGIGFIGAGAILRMGINVRGLTTAASIWAIAAIGLAIGAGMYFPAALAVVFMLIILIVVEQLERFFFTPMNIKLLTIVSSSPETDKIIEEILREHHSRILDVNPTIKSDNLYELTYKITAPDRKQWVELSQFIMDSDKNISESRFHDPIT